MASDCIHPSGRLDYTSIRRLVSVVDCHLHRFLSDPIARKSLWLKCSDRLAMSDQSRLDSSVHSVLSSLYQGIESMELAILAECDKERCHRLSASEMMLQVPAFLEEDGCTAGIANRFLVCCSYYYLSLVSRLCIDEWRMTIHFLQSLLVSPQLVRVQFAPPLWNSLFGPLNRGELEEDVDKAVRHQARLYKYWLMYYQVVSYGKNPLSYNESRHSTCSIGSLNSQNCTSLLSPPEPMKKNGLEISEKTITTKEIEGKDMFLLTNRSRGSLESIRYPILDWKDFEADHVSKTYTDDQTQSMQSPNHDFRCFSKLPSKLLKKYTLHEFSSSGCFARKRISFSNTKKESSAESSTYEMDTQNETVGNFKKAMSSICYSASKWKAPPLEGTLLLEMIKNKAVIKYSLLKEEILDQLLEILSISKKEDIVRASMSTLLALISEDRNVLDHIRKELHLCDLARALKNTPEAAILIYLLKPSPSDIRSLELLPALLEVACNSGCRKEDSTTLPLSPASASIAVIEHFVTHFDNATNNAHLDELCSPRVLAKLIDVALQKNLEENVTLAAILVRCMHIDANCKKFLVEVAPVDPFLQLLQSNEKLAKFAALNYFHETLCMPRSSAIKFLNQIRQQGGINIMYTLLACIQQYEHEPRLLAADFLLQLDMLEASKGRSMFKEVAVEALLDSITSEENTNVQKLSASILSNLGGTYNWTGEPYTAAWLVKKTGLSSASHRNLIKSIDWLDPCLKDTDLDPWCSKTARSIVKLGRSVFTALAKGIQSRTGSVSRDCLICIAWLGNEMSLVGPCNLRYFACEILISCIPQFLHPGTELDERILSCLCLYNYTSGKGKEKLMNFSDCLRESLRRLSSITWMAEELLKVTDFFISTKPRVSCLHTQSLEACQFGSGSVTALIFYKGHLYAGYSDGSIKAWELKGQTALLMWEVREHKKAVTCFALLEPGGSLLSGSYDKTVRVWQRVRKKLESVEVIEMKEPVHKLETYGDKILVITQGRGVKVIHSSRIFHTICKNKHIKCLASAQGKLYLGCSDSSIQEVDITADDMKVLRSPAKSWRIQNKPITSIHVFKGWVYCAGSIVEGSTIRDWRRYSKAQMTIPDTKGMNICAMEVVEDFIYLICSSSLNIIQIWLRGMQKKIGRLSAGGKITSVIAANDMIICGTDTGVIKGWIPL